MNILPINHQIEAIAALTEGCSIRATERLTGVHRDTIMRLGVRVGEGCQRLHDGLFRDLQVPILEFDEIWSYVGKKQARTQIGEIEKGDQYTYTALASTSRALIAYRIGKRGEDTTRAFVNDVWERIINRPQISTDGYGPYIAAIAEAFGDGADYAQLIKHYSADHAVEAKRRYSPASVVRVERRVVSGRRDRHIRTSLVERSNLTFRMQQRRFTRLTNGFSKKLANHRAAVGLFVAHYNLCRVHESLRVTPGMAQGVTDHIWDIGELIEAATTGETPTRYAPFAVIDGGLS